jgi:hypothetical protein
VLPLILIGLGAISLGATAATIYVKGETEEERKRQRNLRSKHAAFRRKKSADRRTELALLIAEYRADAEEKLAIREKVVLEFQAVLDELARQLSDGQFTPSRRAALFSLRQKFEAKKRRLESFSAYLREYIRSLEDVLDEAPEPPGNSLPAGYPYPGAVLTFSRQELESLSSRSTDLGPRLFVFDRSTMDHPALESWERFPVLVSWGRGGRLGCSINRGILLTAHLDPGSPFRATVTKVRRSFSDVKAYGVRMRIHREDQRVRHRKLLLGSELTVYGLQYSYDLEPFQVHGKAKDWTRVLVTEREDRAGHEDQFKQIPLWVKENFEAVVGQLADLVESKERWLVAPDPDAEDAPRVRFQNRNLGFWARFEKVDGGVCLEYEKPLEANAAIETGGIYAAFPATIVPQLYGGEGTEQEKRVALESCELFAFFVAHEFERQRQILESNEGGLFYRQWEMITRRLIEEASWSDPFPVEIEEALEKPDKRWALYPCKAREVAIWFERQGSAYLEAFIDGDRIGVIESHEGGAYLLLDPRRDVEIVQDVFLGDLYIRVRQKPVAERRQLDSLQSFRIGNVVNQTIKTYVLNPKAFSKAPPFDRIEIRPFDQRIAEDESQLKILQNMVSCPDLYALQGPPGAGKTTVIVELVRQELVKNPTARILVTSQANIAVDNVLEALRSYLPPEILIRCGNPNKISANLQDLTMQARHTSYRAVVEQAHVRGTNKELVAWWRSELSEHVDSHFGEVMLRQASVVGATCVYLGNHRKGLDRLDFDLVVVDEAGRATPPELLIPLIRARRAVVIGDHYQLPPFIEPSIREGKLDFGISKAELDELISHNLFARLHGAAPEDRRSMLSTTYRLPGQVAKLVSKTFYDGKIKASKASTRSRIFADTLTWADTSKLDGYSEHRVGTSLVNYGEAKLVLDLMHFIVESAWEVFDAKTERPLHVAVLSPYAAQVSLLRRNLAGLIAQEGHHGVAIDVETIDAYQGKEADLVIYAATRSARPSEFLNDRFRLNVALSRVKRELVVIGSANSLCQMVPGSGRNILAEVYAFFSREGVCVPISRLGRAGLAGIFTEAARPKRAAKKLSGFEENKDVRVLSVHPRRRRWEAESVGVIDVGSTGLRYLGVAPNVYVDGFLKAPADPGHRLFEENERLDLGAGVKEHSKTTFEGEGTSRITARASERFIQTVKKVRDKNGSFGLRPEDIIAVGTSLFRTAENGNDIIARLKKETGVDLWPISGLFEATIGLVGLLLSQGQDLADNQPVITVDLGGGSTEVSLSFKKGTDIVVMHQSSIPYGKRAIANELSNDVPETATKAANRVREIAGTRFSAERLPDVGEKPLILCMGGAIQRIARPPKGTAGKLLRMDDLIHKLGVPPKRGLRDDQFHTWFPALIGSTRGKEAHAVSDWLDIHVAGEALCALMRHYGLTESRFYKMALRHALAYLMSLGWTRTDMEKVLI